MPELVPRDLADSVVLVGGMGLFHGRENDRLSGIVKGNNAANTLDGGNEFIVVLLVQFVTLHHVPEYPGGMGIGACNRPARGILNQLKGGVLTVVIPEVVRQMDMGLHGEK